MENEKICARNYVSDLHVKVNKGRATAVTIADLHFATTGPQFRDMTRDSKEDALAEVLEDCAEMFFGVSREKLSAATVAGVIKRFTGVLNHLTKQDVEYAFKRAEISPVIGRTLTYADLYYPIARWSSVRNDIRKAKWQISNESNEQAARDHAAEKFLNEAKRFYMESRTAGLWKGSVFHASALIKAFPFKASFTPDELEGFQVEAVKMEKAASNSNLFLQTLAISADYHFAGLVIAECVQRKLICF